MHPETLAYDSPAYDPVAQNNLEQDSLDQDTLEQDPLELDTLSRDMPDSRPLPKWLTDQKEGLTTIQPEKLVMREDNSLKISFIITGIIILVLVSILTLYIIRKHKTQA